MPQQTILEKSGFILPEETATEEEVAITPTPMATGEILPKPSKVKFDDDQMLEVISNLEGRRGTAGQVDPNTAVVKVATAFNKLSDSDLVDTSKIAEADSAGGYPGEYWDKYRDIDTLS